MPSIHPPTTDGSPPDAGLLVRAASRTSQLRIAQSLSQAAMAIAGVLVITFCLVRVIPGDASVTLGGNRATEEVRTTVRERLHLDDSLLTQFASYLRGLVQGDLGPSMIHPSSSVTEILGRALPVTLALVVAACLLATVAGVSLGLLGAMNRGRLVDETIRIAVAIMLATPPFLTGLVLILVVALDWRLLPPGGWGETWQTHLDSLILPALALAGYMTPMIIRTTRQAAIAAFEEQWADAALARGMTPRRLAVTHVLPNSLAPVVALVGYNVGSMISAAVVAEAVFDLPGIGTELANAVAQRDYPVIQGIALATAVVVVLSNLIADVVTKSLDPRTGRA